MSRWSRICRIASESVKAVREPMRTGTVRLHDLANDLGETKDLAAERRDLALRATRHMDEAHVPDPLRAVR
jgi:hypothetical protein